MSPLVNATGKDPLCPACPSCKAALVPEPRPTVGGKTAAGFWHCYRCHKVYKNVPEGHSLTNR